MPSQPCIEHVGVWATWDGIDGHPADAEICIRVHPVPNTRIPILQYSNSSVIDVDLQDVIRLEHPLVKETDRLGGQATPPRVIELDGTPGTEKIERRLIGSPIHGPPQSVRRHIFPKRPKCDFLEIAQADLGSSKPTPTVLPLDKQTPSALVDSVLKAKPQRKRSEQTPCSTRENQKSLRDDVGPLLSVVEDALCPENVSFVVLPEDKRFVSGSTAEIFLPSRSCSPDEEGSQRRSCDGTNTSTIIRRGGRPRRGAVTIEDSAATEARRKLNNRMSLAAEPDKRERGRVSDLRALSVVHNPSPTPPATQGVKSPKATSSSKKAPWHPPAQIYTTSWSKASPGKAHSPKGSMESGRRSIGKKKGQTPSGPPVQQHTSQQGKAGSSEQLGRTMGRKSGKLVDRLLDGPFEEKDNSRGQSSRRCRVVKRVDDGSPFHSPQWTFYEDPASPGLSNVAEYSSPTLIVDRDLSMKSRDSGFSMSSESDKNLSKRESLELKTPNVVMVEDGGIIYAFFPPESTATPLQLEFAVKVSIEETSRSHGRLFEIRGLPWHQGATSRAAFIINKEFDKDGVQFHIPNFNERFLQISTSSVIGNFDLLQPLQLYFRKAHEIPTHMAFDTVVETYSKFAYSPESGITAHYKLVLYLHGPGEALLDILKREVCTTYTIRNGPEDSAAYRIAGEGKDCQRLVASNQFDDNHGRCICIISEAADIGCPITIEFDMNLGDVSKPLQLPFILPTAGTGKVVAEMMAISELPFPMHPDFTHDASHAEWVYIPYPASPISSALHKFFRVKPPSTWDNGISLKFSLFKEYRLNQIGGFPDSLMPSPGSLELSLYIPPERTGRPPFGCGMLLDTQVWGNLSPPDMIEFQPNGWQLSSAWVDGRPAGRWQFYETPRGGIGFFLKGQYWVGSILQLRLHWILVDDMGNQRVSQVVGQREKYECKLPQVKVDHIHKIFVRSDIDDVIVTARSPDGETSCFTTKRDCTTSLSSVHSQVPEFTIEISPAACLALTGDEEAFLAAARMHLRGSLTVETDAELHNDPTPPSGSPPPSRPARSWWNPQGWGMPPKRCLLIFVSVLFYVANWSQFRRGHVQDDINRTAVMEPSLFGLAEHVPGAGQAYLGPSVTWPQGDEEQVEMDDEDWEWYFGFLPSMTWPDEEAEQGEIDDGDWEELAEWPPRGEFTPFAEYVPYEPDDIEDAEVGEESNDDEHRNERVEGDPPYLKFWEFFARKVRDNARKLYPSDAMTSEEVEVCGPSCSSEDAAVIRYLAATVARQDKVGEPWTEERRQVMIQHVMFGLPQDADPL